MPTAPLLSLIVPTRGQPESLRRFLASVAATAMHLDALEIILVLDSDDAESRAIDLLGLPLRRVIGSPGRTMGELNGAGYRASTGRWLMLLNDDVVVWTRGWDDRLRACFAAFPDEILLVHVSDRLFETALCTFPIVSRTYCDLAGGICPGEYGRYCIDDHIEDVFNLLTYLGERRTLYLPDVVFEHRNWKAGLQGEKRYCCDQNKLAGDAGLFAALLPQRKELAIRLMQRMQPDAASKTAWQQKLESVSDSLALRTVGRQRVCFRPGWPGWLARMQTLARRGIRKVRQLTSCNRVGLSRGSSPSGT
jgi:hypothetical protein